MAPRTNSLTNGRTLPARIASLFWDDDKEKDKAQHTLAAPFNVVLEVAQQLGGAGDDESLPAAVARAQAHQIAASFIRTAREHAGLTTAELAARIGVSPAYLSDAQSYRSIRKIPLDLLILVANACDEGNVALAFEPQQDRTLRRRAIDRFRQRVRDLRRRQGTAAGAP